MSPLKALSDPVSALKTLSALAVSRCTPPCFKGWEPAGIQRDFAGEMEKLASAASFPVVFFDGDREIDIGTITVYPSLGFKRFLTIISQKIGVAPHQISTSLVRRKKARTAPEIRRKVTIDESSDFSSIASERDCFVLAILKRSRRTRSRRRGGGGAAGVFDAEQRKAAAAAVPEKTILKRNPAAGSLIDDPFDTGLLLWDYESQLQNLQKQRERYLLSTTAAEYSPYAAEASSLYESWRERGLLGEPERPPPSPPSPPSAVCEECFAAKEEGRAPAFHWCVYDAVTVGFRSAVGPIQRPQKKHIEASA